MLRTPKQAKVSILNEATSRKFDGGLNVADTQLNLSSKYATVLSNLLVGLDGSLQIRQGTKLFASLAEVSSHNLIGGEYFRANLIVMNEIGELFAINGLGVITPIWNATIAAAKRPGLTIWQPVTYVAFEEFNGELIVASINNKPLVINSSLIVDYLADVTTASNINVPVGEIIAKFSLHFCIAVGSILHVSERNASGTWQGDAGAQFVNQFDMKTYVVKGDTDIIALLPFKGYLLVMFRECIVPVQFVEDATATPKLALSASSESVINNYGCISPKVVQDIGESGMSTDIVGCSSISLSRFTRVLSPDRPSRLIDKLLQQRIHGLSDETLKRHAFSVYDRKMSAYQLYLPDANHPLHRTTTGYSYRYVERLNLEAWSLMEGWYWLFGIRSSQGNMFFNRAESTEIFQRGDEETDPLYADWIGEQETFSDGTTFTDQTGFGPVADINDSGVPIKWVWELPWNDLKHRAFTKTLRYIILDTEGGDQFTCKVFIDDHYLQYSPGETFSDGTLFTDGTGFTPPVEPLFANNLEMQYVGKDHGGFGVEPFGPDPYGGGNNTAIRKLTLAPTKFTTFKLRFEGESTRPLKFVAITLLYQGGSIRRLPL
jgi:hypothetical protein